VKISGGSQGARRATRASKSYFTSSGDVAFHGAPSRLEIGDGNPAGNALVQAAIDGLLDQTRTIERIIAALDLGPLELEGSDSLEDPEAVFQ